jgi:hypothetical protein
MKPFIHTMKPRLRPEVLEVFAELKNEGGQSALLKVYSLTKKLGHRRLVT